MCGTWYLQEQSPTLCKANSSRAPTPLCRELFVSVHAGSYPRHREIEVNTIRIMMQTGSVCATAMSTTAKIWPSCIVCRQTPARQIFSSRTICKRICSTCLHTPFLQIHSSTPKAMHVSFSISMGLHLMMTGRSALADARRREHWRLLHSCSRRQFQVFGFPKPCTRKPIPCRQGVDV